MKLRWVVLAALAGCTGNQTNVIVARAEITVAPLLTDLGDVPVDGQPLPFEITLVHTAGTSAHIGSVLVQNLDGDAFSFVGDAPFDLGIDESIQLPMEYAPTEAGYQRAQVTVVSDATEHQIIVDVRAHGVVGEPDVWPRVLDFGVVDGGDTRDLVLTVANGGSADLSLAGATFNAAGFTLTTPMPLRVAAGSQANVTVEFAADSSDAVDTTAILDFGAAASPTVGLRANDCQNGAPAAYDEDGDGVSVCAGDCDDHDPTVRPGAPELADGLDNDCNGTIDEGTLAYDDDGDCYCETDTCSGGVSASCATLLGGDCADGDPDIHPDAVEVLGDGVDGNCDGVVDSGSSDVDGDGYAPAGGDCNDLDPAIHPGAPERPNGIDEDCDGSIDEGTINVDDDHDGTSEVQGDCDDTDPLVHPGAAERPNWRDDDCDGRIDNGTVNFDDDGDGFTETGGDCDDASAAIHPGATEVVGNGVDEDCNSGTGP